MENQNECVWCGGKKDVKDKRRPFCSGKCWKEYRKNGIERLKKLAVDNRMLLSDNDWLRMAVEQMDSRWWALKRLFKRR